MSLSPTELGPLTLYSDDENIYGLNNTVRFARDLPLPDEQYIGQMVGYYRANLTPLAPGVIHGSTHELAAWLITDSARLVLDRKAEAAAEAVKEAGHYLVVGQDFPNDPIWKAAVQYNLGLCDLLLRSGPNFNEIIRRGRVFLDEADASAIPGANAKSYEVVDRAIRSGEEFISRWAQPGVSG